MLFLADTVIYYLPALFDVFLSSQSCEGLLLVTCVTEQTQAAYGVRRLVLVYA